MSRVGRSGKKGWGLAGFEPRPKGWRVVLSGVRGKRANRRQRKSAPRRNPAEVAPRAPTARLRDSTPVGKGSGCGWTGIPSGILGGVRAHRGTRGQGDMPYRAPPWQSISLRTCSAASGRAWRGAPSGPCAAHWREGVGRPPPVPLPYLWRLTPDGHCHVVLIGAGGVGATGRWWWWLGHATWHAAARLLGWTDHAPPAAHWLTCLDAIRGNEAAAPPSGTLAPTSVGGHVDARQWHRRPTPTAVGRALARSACARWRRHPAAEAVRRLSPSPPTLSRLTRGCLSLLS